VIAKEWSEHLVNKLLERYKIAEEEAQHKVDSWLQSHQVSESGPQTLTAAAPERSR
jgi:hypothetical protein